MGGFANPEALEQDYKSQIVNPPNELFKSSMTSANMPLPPFNCYQYPGFLFLKPCADYARVIAGGFPAFFIMKQDVNMSTDLIAIFAWLREPVFAASCRSVFLRTCSSPPASGSGLARRWVRLKNVLLRLCRPARAWCGCRDASPLQ